MPQSEEDASERSRRECLPTDMTKKPVVGGGWFPEGRMPVSLESLLIRGYRGRGGGPVRRPADSGQSLYPSEVGSDRH